MPLPLPEVILAQNFSSLTGWSGYWHQYVRHSKGTRSQGSPLWEDLFGARILAFRSIFP
jgi:hypothetical protein